MDTFNELLLLLKANLGNVFTGLIGLVTTVLGYKVMFGKNNIDLAKVKVEHKQADLNEDRFSLERASQIDQRMDRLVAHLERQLENAAADARKEREQMRQEREEMKSVMATQTKEIRTLRDHIDLLAETIIGLGGIVPRLKSTEDK